MAKRSVNKNKATSGSKPKVQSGLKDYTKGNKRMTQRQEYKLSRQANRYSYRENTANIRAGTQKTVARAGAATVGATSAADSAAELSTKNQAEQQVYVFDQAAQGFLPTEDKNVRRGDEGTEITSGSLTRNV